MEKLQVVQAKFLENNEKNWQELFSGFDELHAITFSSGIQFISQIVDMFRSTDIIFGCESTLLPQMATIMSANIEMIERISKGKCADRLLEHMNDGSLRCYISRDTMSHEKLFILKSYDGRTRVIIGSANMSASAFMGLQREIIVYFDDVEAYDYYKARFELFRSMCVDSIEPEYIQAEIEAPGHANDTLDIPVIATVKSKSTAIVIDTVQDDNTDVDISVALQGHESELKAIMPRPKTNKNIVGRILLQTQDLVKMLPEWKVRRETVRVQRELLPKLHLDMERHSLSFNNKEMDLNPSTDEVRSDVVRFLDYLDSLSVSYGPQGACEESQATYFRFACWYFASLFMPYLRLVGYDSNYDEYMFPVYAVIYGTSNGGKSTFLRLLTKMMCGANVQFVDHKLFTPSKIIDLRRGAEGLPLVFDDLDKDKWSKYADGIIKDDAWGTRNRFVNYPAVVVTSNKVPSVAPDIAKRVMLCHINTTIDREVGRKNSKKMNENMRNMGSALFREYVRRMFVVVDSMTSRMYTSLSEGEAYVPDIVLESSRVICEILSEFGDAVDRSYVREVEYADWAGEEAVGRRVVERIKTAWLTEPKQFSVDRRRNELSYEYPANNSNIWELKYIQDELPPKVNAKRLATKLVMDLDAMEELCGMRFRKKLFVK